MDVRASVALVLMVVLAGCSASSPSASPRPSGPSAAPIGPSAAPSAIRTSSWEPTGIGLDRDSYLLVTDCTGGFLYRVDASGAATKIAGTGVSSTEGGLSGENVPALQADLHCPADATADPAGDILVVDHANNRIRLIGSDGLIHTIIGSGPIGTSSNDGTLAGDGGPALAATLQEPWEIVFDGHGDLFIADRDNHAIRRVDPAMTITTVAGSGDRGYSGDGGKATMAQLNRPQGIAVDADGNVFFSDSDNHRIRKVDLDGVITTVAGTGQSGYAGDGGPATGALIDDPNGMAFDTAGDLYFVDDSAMLVRRIGLDGTISTVAGIGGQPGFLGDGGPAASAALDAPSDLIFDAEGNLYIADQGNHRIRIVRPDGTIDTFSVGLR